MLILTRKVGETLMIGDDIQILVAGVTGMQIKIGIDAPRDVQILREELLQNGSRKYTPEDAT